MLTFRCEAKQLTAFGCLAVAVFAAGAAQAGDWPQWRGPNRDGVAPDSPELADAWPAEGPPRLWSSEPLFSGIKSGLGSPVVASGRVYVCYSQKIDISTNQPGLRDIIACVNATDGKTVWKKEYPGCPYGKGAGGSHGFHLSSTPCVVGGRVYVNGYAAMYCLDAANGDEVWKGNVWPERRSDGAACSPIVLDGKAIAAGSPLTAFDALTGQVRWTQKGVCNALGSPVAWKKNGRDYVLINRDAQRRELEKVVCVDVQTGEIAWEAPGGGYSTPAIDGDNMLVLSGGLACYKLSPEKAETMWATNYCAGRHDGTSPHLYNKHAYGIGESIICVDVETGKEVSRKKSRAYELQGAIFADGKILTGGACSLPGVPEERGMIMLRLAPTGSTVLAMASLKEGQTAFFDGKLVIKGEQALHCYDLTRQAMMKVLPRYTVSRAVEPPKVDGLLDEAVWKSPVAITNFHLPATFRPNNLPKKEQPPGPPTVARLAWDERCVYVAFRCEEPKLESLRLKAQQRDDSVSGDDSVEFFLDADADRQTYHQIMVNAAGIVYDACGFDKSWNGQIEVATGRELGAWTLEMAVPWASLGVAAPKAGANIRFLMVRNRYAAGNDELTMWPAMNGHTTHNPLLFADGLLSQ